MKRKVFYRSNVDQVKNEIKSFLDSNSETPTDRLDLIVKNINHLRNENTSKARLLIYVYIMSALVHHLRHGGLLPSHITRFIEYAEALLMAEDIVPGESRLSFLYVELYAVLSQIDRNSGDHWGSTWKLMSSFYFQHRPIESELAWKNLGIAIRLLRLKYTKSALENYKACERELDKNTSMFQAKIGQVICNKLMTNFDESLGLLKNLDREAKDQPDSFLLDIEWERNCCQTMQDGDPSRLFKLVNKRKDGHNHPSYLLEAYLWSKLSRPFEESQVCKPSTIARKHKVNHSSVKNLFRACSALEKALDGQYPMIMRLRFIGNFTEYAAKVLTVDRELLIWSVACKWLQAYQFPILADVCLNNYKSSCQQLSLGKTDNLLCAPIFDH